MSWLGVIGNVSVDTSTYPSGATYRFVGGAALHVALAASQHLPAAPIAVIGADLAWLTTDSRVAVLDRKSMKVSIGASCAFLLQYDEAGHLAAIDCDYGVATRLTDHALTEIGRHDRYHVCCRRPLDVERVLDRLAGEIFSLDFYVSSVADLLTAAGRHLPKASAIFVDAAEADLLAGEVSFSRLPALVISDGPCEVRLLRYGQVVASVEPPEATPTEVTGAGDTLAGTFLASQAWGDDDQQALRKAVEAATASVQHMGLTVPTAKPS